MSKSDVGDQIIRQIKKGNVTKALDMLGDSSLSPNFIDKKTGKNLVQLAIESEEPQLVSHLLSLPSLNPNFTNASGDQSILQTAVLYENTESIEKLMSLKVDPSKVNSKNHSAIYLAVHSNKCRALECFWKYDSELVVNDAAKLFSLGLDNTCNEACIFLAKQLPVKQITRGDQAGDNLIHLAVEANKPAIVKELLERITSASQLTDIQKQFALNSQNKKGDTYLHLSYRNQLQTMIGVLEDSSFKELLNRQIKNQKGETIKDIVRKNELLKESQLRRQDKLREQKKQREIEKQELKRREIQLAEKQLMEQKREEKKQAQMETRQKVNQGNNKIIITVAVVLVLILLTYLGIEYSLANSKKNREII